MEQKRTRRTWSVVVAAAVTWGTPILAQAPPDGSPAVQEKPSTPPEQDPFKLEVNVEVTATRGATDEGTSPVSSTVVKRDEIESRNLRYLDQALGQVEGVTEFRTRGVQDTDFGVGMRGFNGRGSGQSRVLVLLDGQPVNDSYTGSVNWASLPIGEVDRVEVARGPFSSLYGGNAMGGVINVMTRPVEGRAVEATGQYGQQDTGAYSLRYSDRYFGRLGVSAGYSAMRTGGYPSQEVLRPATVSTATGGVPVTGITRYLTPTGTVNYSVGQRGNNRYSQDAIRARVEYTFTPKTYGSFQYLHQSSDYSWDMYRSALRGPSGEVIDNGNVIFQEGGAWRRITVAPSNYVGGSGAGTSNTYQAQLLHTTASAGALRVQAGVIDVPQQWYTTPGTGSTFTGGPGTFTDQFSRGIYLSMQYSPAPHGRHALTMGVDTRHDNSSIGVLPTPDWVAADTFTARDSYSAGKAFNQAAFVQDQIAVSDRVQLIAGARYDYWKTYDGLNQKGVGQPVSAYDARDTSSGSGKVAAAFKLNASSTLRASVGTAFRNPTVFELYRDVRFSSGLLLLGNPLVNPEKLLSWEAGIRQDLGPAVHADAAYFVNELSDLIYRTTDFAADPGGQIRRLVNAGHGRTRGAEFSLNARGFGWLTARGSYTFNDARITENASLPETEGKQVPYVPRHTLTASLGATAGPWTVIAAGRRQSSVFATDTNADVVQGVPGGYQAFGTVDLTVGYQLRSKVSLYLNVDNLFDYQYWTFYRAPGRVVLGGFRFKY